MMIMMMVMTMMIMMMVMMIHNICIASINIWLHNDDYDDDGNDDS